jgi:hypothetical protein
VLLHVPTFVTAILCCHLVLLHVPPQDNRVLVLPGLDSNKIARALETTANYKILEFSDANKLWPKYAESGGWFTDPAVHQHFVQRIRFMTSVICCLNQRPGWMWYDLQWDVPHTVRCVRVRVFKVFGL